VALDQWASTRYEALAAGMGHSFTATRIRQQNWNAQWEAGFEPVTVPGFCTVRAHFHAPAKGVPYEIVITPKMSFGTGHHATTRLMMMQMQHLNLAGKEVLDFGTGTGILAILAEQLGARRVLAIDNDEWSVENTTENLERNNCSRTEIVQGSLEVIGDQTFDVVLANINRHILLHYMQQLFACTRAGGQLLMSGLLLADRQVATDAALEAGFREAGFAEQGGWITLLMSR
jgi:ribosomal protein L11 methyltransferase